MPTRLASLDPQTRSRIRNIVAAYLFTMAFLFSAATSWPATESVAEAETGRGGLFLATETPGKLQAAPLVASRVDMTVSGMVARVKVTQTFTNPRNIWLEGIYTFPLPEKSAVDRLTMKIGDRKITGIIQEKEQAKKTYEQAKKSGKRASLVTQERPNIFSTALANIGPGETVTIIIEYRDRARFDQGAFSLRFPMVVRPRYIPGNAIEESTPLGSGWAYDTDQVQDGSRITPPIADPDGTPINPVRLFVTLDPGFPLGRIESIYHPVDISEGVDGRTLIVLKNQRVTADRDFELVWRPKSSSLPSAGLFSETIGGFDYHLLMMVPPSTQDADDVRTPRELIFILDKSGSMGGTAIRQAKAALTLALKRLQTGDRFNIIVFDSDAYPLFDHARDYTEDTATTARNFINRIGAGGGTEMASALSLALNGSENPGRIRQIIFITDGAVGNEETLFRMIKAGLGDSRLFTVGISSAPNSFFMTEAAEAGRGTFTYIGDLNEVSEKMSALFQKLESPALTDLHLQWPDNADVKMYPDPIPDLYSGEPVMVVARLPRGMEGNVILQGQRGHTPFRRDLKLIPDGMHTGIATLWARAKITDIIRSARKPGGPNQQDARKQILKVALNHQLVSKYTSLVAVDEEIARPKEQQIASATMPTNLPHGMDPAFVKGSAGVRATAPVPPPDQILRIRKASLDSGTLVTLPQTATDAEIRMLIGALLMLIAIAAFALARRTAKGVVL